MADLRQRGIVTKRRWLKTGKMVGANSLTRGPLAHLLRNRFYIGEVKFKGEILPGEQPAILERDLFETVKAKLTEQANSHTTARMQSEALLTGRLFDNRGNRMSPTHARKGGIKYRYYLSSALTDGRPDEAGTVNRVPATEIETVVARSVRGHLKLQQAAEDKTIIDAYIDRVEVHSQHLSIRLSENSATDNTAQEIETICVPWQKQPSKRRREILLPTSQAPADARPIRSETRATLIAAIARGRRWLDEIVTTPGATAETIAQREDCSPRKVNMTISLAFLSPALVKAALDGRLPRGIGATRLCDMPPEWSRQHLALGLNP
jgi:hypothetical protein